METSVWLHIFYKKNFFFELFLDHVGKFLQGRSSELESSFLSRLTLWWFNSIPLLGARKDLEVDDLYHLNEGNSSEYLVPKWEKLWLPAVRSKFFFCFY